MTAVAVRRAVPADAAAIARVHVRGWHEAYTGRMPQSILDRLDLDRLTRVRRELLGHEQRLDERESSGAARPNHTERTHDLGRTWVAVTGGSIVGFAVSGSSRDDPPVAPVELYAIYVLAAHHGTGAGQALLDAALGDESASLWVLADNPRARAFYARNGFRPDGAEKDDTSWGESISEVRLVRE
ncbi:MULTISPECIES: GNAT family N-acetyltransferase [Microbacterium]|uniref:GNAT family N-acetyltransferase n=1 Tax=Microbacterium TaxID=33882 RepID=UPI00249F41BA|nr:MULTISPECIES: GNAT family N-acetyltransferase [Microbacterium]WHE35858.1 GNAT family N-acetyltransferase [Microbacterium sp. BDGP8]WRK17028.1 GNAT family N-acetyltransferase [Microbacterium plantarum]